MTWGAIGAAAIGVIGGGLLGGQQSTSTTDSQRSLPTYLDPYINGSGGLLSSVSSLSAQQAQNGGLNPLQSAGMEAQRQFLTSPQYTAGYGQERGLGMDLMGRSVAGNPFTSGNTGGLGGYGSLSGQGAGGQASHPSLNASTFSYDLNPTLSGALNPLAAPTATTAPTTASPTIDQIIAELQRRQQLSAYQQSLIAGYGGSGDASGGPGIGPGSNSGNNAAPGAPGSNGGPGD
jgi:hypothetical protein